MSLPARRTVAAPAPAVLVAVLALVGAGCTGDQQGTEATADPPPTAADSPADRTPTTTPPTTQTTPTTEPPTEPATPAPAVTVTLVGDIMLGRGVADVAAAAGDPSAPLRPMADRLARADITVGNLESTLSTSGPPRQGSDSFAAPPAVLSGLRDAGFDVLSLANNHTGDYGLDALVETVRRVRSSGIAPVGAGRDRATAWRPVVVRRAGVRVGFLAFNAIGETYRPGADSPGAASLRMSPRTGPLRPAELRRLQQRVRALAARTDAVIVYPHWGEQYIHEAVPDQPRVGRALLDAGATVVVGGHPHVVQEVQPYRGRFVVHSLGNFVFDMDFSTETQQGVTLDLTLRDGELVRTRVTPYVIGTDFAPRPVTGPVADEILADIDGLRLLPR